MTDHVLVVDDDSAIRSLVALILKSEDYRVVTASDGREALAAIAREAPSAMFLDMRMPVLDGWGVAHTLHEQGRRVPTVVMTAEADVHRCCQEVGADACLSKPFDVDDVLNAAAQVSGRHADS